MDDQTVKKIIDLRQDLVATFSRLNGYKNNQNAIMKEIDHAKTLHETIKKLDSILKEHVNFSDPYMLYANYSNISSIEHIDHTSRVQTVEKNTGVFRKLIENFYKKTNCPYLLNTSLNINGKPIIGNMEELKNYFNSSDIDILVIGNQIWRK